MGSRTARSALLLAAALLCPTPAVAQGPARVVAGVVRDSASGVGIAGAEVREDATGLRALTNEQGAFQLSVAAPDRTTLSVRRLGFLPATVAVSPASAGQVAISLVPSLLTLRPVLVRAERTRYTGRLAGYYERLERRSIGQFITRADLERERPTQLTDMLQRAPGVSIARGRPGVARVRMRGRDCSPLVWLDGFALGMGDVDLDAFSPESLEGIEMYLGAAGAPSRFQAARGKSECGTILLWTRATSAMARRQSSGASAAELEELVKSLSVFTADQVDVPAAPDTSRGGAIPYPDAMRASGTSGRVVAEFVVDTTGRVELLNLAIVSSTNGHFTDAVRDALSVAAFTPAIRKGGRVRQLVRQPYEFTAPARDRVRE